MRMSRGSRSSFASRSGSLVTKQPPKDNLKRKTRAILVTRNSGGIGDMLMITPVIRQIKKEHPNKIGRAHV